MEALVLMSSTPKDSKTESLQRMMAHQLEANKVVFTEIDGANAENKDIRSKLLGLPGAKRAVYPQLFTKDPATGDYAYVADPQEWEKLVENNDYDHKLDELLKTLARRA